MIFIAMLYYKNEKILYYDLTKSNMQNKLSEISSKVILSHMTNSFFDKSKILTSKDYKIAFYDENMVKIFGNLDDKIDFTKKIVQLENSFVLLDDSVLGHLGVYYIAIKENIYFKKIDELKYDILIVFCVLYLIITMVGLYLAKLFLKPIKDEREKLNNFIKDTTHELNTPITAILMSTENPTLGIKQVERIRLSTIRISEIYKDLTYTFLENHENMKLSQTLNIKEVIEEQLPYFEILCQKKKISLKKELEDFEFYIVKDDCIRIFNNLFSNAIKYNKVGGNITITLKDGTFIISDSGIGIEKEKIKDIFNRYYRATKEQGGFGLGLNIVNQVCNNYNITIEVKSTQEIGTTFILKFI